MKIASRSTKGKRMRVLELALVSTLLLGCATAGGSTPGAGTPAGYGLAAGNPVEVCMPDGERRYLARLVCPSGAHPEFSRGGSVGPRTPLPSGMSQGEMEKLLDDQLAGRPLAAGAPDYHWIDAYEVRCGTETTTVFLDMYHCNVDPPVAAPDGFTILR
jgi:hypothetical protein